VFVAAGPAAAGHDAALRAGVAVELVHSATLVHDDVLDAAVLRRGRPTVVASAGRSIATATGDLLFSRAFAELARLDLRAVRTPEQAENVCDAIAATGALEAARQEALAMVAEAKADLPALPEPSQQAALELVADGVVDRYS
jgi:geranylgeranyl pyrophosphate synthase